MASHSRYRSSWLSAPARRRVLAAMGAVLLLCLLLSGCGTPSATPADPTATPPRATNPLTGATATSPRHTSHTTATVAPVKAAGRTPRATAARTRIPRVTPTPSATETPTDTPTSTRTPTTTPTPTRTPHPYWSPTPTPTPTPIVLSRVATSGQLIALTFDCDAQTNSASAVSTILDYLQSQHVAATFGVSAAWAARNPALVRRMTSQGEQIIAQASTTTSGAPTATEPIAGELDGTEALLRHLTGSLSRPYYRLPDGAGSAATHAAAAAAGFKVQVRWSLDTGAWTGLTPDQVATRLLDAATPGGIVLLHAGSRDALALPRVLEGLRARGYRFVTVAGLLAADHRPDAPPIAAPSSYRAVDHDAVYYPATARGPLSGYVVLLDVAHGGPDPGTCYPYGFSCFPTDPNATPVLDEKTAVLDIALYRLLPRLHLLGADVYLTRTTEEQDPSLEARLQLANYVARSPATRGHALFISLNLNGSGDPTVDYLLGLYAAHRPSALAATLVAALAPSLQPAPSGGNQGIETFPGHVLRRNRMPATISEPVFLTNVYPVVVPISITQSITASSGDALRHGLHLHAPTVMVTARRTQGRHHAVVALREAFHGRPPLGTAITLARTEAFSALLSMQLTRWMPFTVTRQLALTAPLTPTALLNASIPPTITYAISVTGAVSTTATQTIYAGEGPWLSRAHQATLHANPDYNTPQPTQLPLHYARNDREENITDGLLRGIAAFFKVALPGWILHPWISSVGVQAVVPAG